MAITRPLGVRAPGANSNILTQLAEQNRRRTNLESEASQARIRQQEAENNRLMAQRYALDNSVQLQSGPNYRTVSDTSMTIEGPSGDNSSSSLQGLRSIGGSRGGGGAPVGGQLPPGLQGRFMPLINMGQLSVPSSPIPPEKSMPTANFSPADAKQYQSAAFSRLKDRAGLLGRSAIESLSSELASRGISGESGTFGRGLSNIIAQSVQPLADLNVEQLGQEYQATDRARQLAEQRASTEFQGGIAQRAQTLQAQQAMDALRAALIRAKYEGEIGQRGQDLSMLSRFL